MKAARDANDREAMLSAVRINWRLWTIVQAELLDPQCAVPMDIRTNVLSLAQFVDKHSVEIIGKPSPKQLDVLISINRELAGGLFTSPRSATQKVDDERPEQGEAASGTVSPNPPRALSRVGAGMAAGQPLRVAT